MRCNLATCWSQVVLPEQATGARAKPRPVTITLAPATPRHRLVFFKTVHETPPIDEPCSTPEVSGSAGSVTASTPTPDVATPEYEPVRTIAAAATARAGS